MAKFEYIQLDDSHIELPVAPDDLFAEDTLPVYTDKHAEAVIFGGRTSLDDAFDGLDVEHAEALADAVESFNDRWGQK